MNTSAISTFLAGTSTTNSKDAVFAGLDFVNMPLSFTMPLNADTPFSLVVTVTGYAYVPNGSGLGAEVVAGKDPGTGQYVLEPVLYDGFSPSLDGRSFAANDLTPEPGTLSLLALMGTVLVARRRRNAACSPTPRG